MDLYEYQVRSLFHQHDVPVLDDAVATTPEKTRSAAQSLLNAGSELAAVKVQVKTGGRGKTGGAKLTRTAEEAETRARDILGMDIKGHTVRAVLISGGVDLDAEYYFSTLLDHAERQYLAMCSREGGMDIGTLAVERPKTLARIGIDSLEGIILAISHRIIEAASFEADPLANEVAAAIERLWEAFTAEDTTLMEVSPLVKAADDRIITLDGKVTFGDNSRFRHPAHTEFVDNTATDSLEARARETGLNCVRLESEIGVLSNGAGLVISTLDIVAGAGGRHGGIKPANFLGLGGGSSVEAMATGLGVVASSPQARAILVNIFGGITSCDTVTQGIVTAIESLSGLPEPVVVRLGGNNADTSHTILADVAIESVTVVDTMDGAVDVVITIAEKISGRPTGREA